MAVGGTRRWVLVGALVLAGVACGAAIAATRDTATTTPSSASSDRQSGASSSATQSGSQVVAAVGDIVCSPESRSYNGGAGTERNCRHEATKAIAESLDPAAVLLLGDIQYECGTAEEFAAFDKSWGTFGDVLRPAIGNHEYGHACDRDDADAYFDYFGDRAGPRGKGWYSYDVGAWHLIALNSECSYGNGEVGGCQRGSEQQRWLLDDLRANPSECTLAYWHEPRFTSGAHGNNESMTDIWNDLVAAGVDVVLTGHNHVYERFEQLGQSDGGPVPHPDGIISFVVGTGGKNLVPFPKLALPGEAIRNADTYGVLALTLRDTSFDWKFVPVVGGGGFTDSGSADCR